MRRGSVERVRESQRPDVSLTARARTRSWRSRPDGFLSLFDRAARRLPMSRPRPDDYYCCRSRWRRPKLWPQRHSVYVERIGGRRGAATEAAAANTAAAETADFATGKSPPAISHKGKQRFAAKTWKRTENWRRQRAARFAPGLHAQISNLISWPWAAGLGRRRARFGAGAAIVRTKNTLTLHLTPDTCGHLIALCVVYS